MICVCSLGYVETNEYIVNITPTNGVSQLISSTENTFTCYAPGWVDTGDDTLRLLFWWILVIILRLLASGYWG